MLAMISQLGAKRFALLEGPPGVLALVIAEIAYKFKSFTLECLAFLATWVVLSAAFQLLRRAWASYGRR